MPCRCDVCDGSRLVVRLRDGGYTSQAKAEQIPFSAKLRILTDHKLIPCPGCTQQTRIAEKVARTAYEMQDSTPGLPGAGSVYLVDEGT